MEGKTANRSAREAAIKDLREVVFANAPSNSEDADIVCCRFALAADNAKAVEMLEPERVACICGTICFLSLHRVSPES